MVRDCTNSNDQIKFEIYQDLSHCQIRIILRMRIYGLLCNEQSALVNQLLPRKFLRQNGYIHRLIQKTKLRHIWINLDQKGSLRFL